MKTILKYKLGNEHNTLSMPKGAKVIKLGIQHGIGCMWALVDDEQPKEERIFSFIETGKSIEDGYYYIGTLLLDDGWWVAHLFEKVS